jgi:saccharopepsin
MDRISVPQQAFLDTSSAQNPALTYGAMGIAGLGMTALSTIDALVNMTNSSTGRSLLYNLFMDNPQDPNFIAFSLERSSDQNDTADGTFSVGRFTTL